MPDVFVPVDTSEYSTYYRDLTAKGITNQYVIGYVDKNRKSISRQFPTIRDFDNGFVVGDYSVPSLTDDTTAYVGVASHGNLPDQNSRLGFSSFRVDGLLSPGLSILIR